MDRRTVLKGFTAAAVAGLALPVPAFAGTERGSGSLVFDDDAFTVLTTTISTDDGAKSVTYRFSEPGVYPYLCTYHVGMVGVVVVGNGVGGAIDTSTADGPVTKVDASDLALENTSAVVDRPSETNGAWPMFMAAAFAIAVGALALMVVRRRRSPAARSVEGR